MGVDPISIGLQAAGSLVQIYGGFQQAAAQRRMARAQQSAADLEASNQRLEQVRQGRIMRARAVQAGENQGAGESSSVTTAASNFTQQASSNIRYIDNQQDISKQITSAKVQIANAGAIQNLGAGISNIGGAVGGHQKGLSEIFGGG